jgi:two-component system, chemotaxis family, chemotaxis protein CheY
MATILVIDDDSQFLEYLKEVLTDEDHTVTTATNGIIGMRQLDTKSFDLLIIDIFMPDKDGLELLREIRNKKIAVKIIGISGGGQNYSPGQALDIAKMLGTTKSLNKPFTKKEIIPLIQELLSE